jgi:phospholipid N-methyltransferase
MFARTFFRFPTLLGSVIPSSRFLVNDLLNQIRWEKARVIVEYGPGVGTITQEILKRMRPDAELVAIELNEEFVTFLRNKIADPRLHAVHASACEVRNVLLRELGQPRADYIVSGIPYSTARCSTVGDLGGIATIASTRRGSPALSIHPNCTAIFEGEL